MQRHARATADDERSRASAPPRREVLVTVLAVVPVVVTAVLAAVMHAPPDGPGAPKPALGTQGHRVAAACAECGVVEAVVPIRPPAAEPGGAWQVLIRMDDGSMRTVQQRGALAAGSRVMLAGGSVRVLSNRPGQG